MVLCTVVVYWTRPRMLFTPRLRQLKPSQRRSRFLKNEGCVHGRKRVTTVAKSAQSSFRGQQSRTMLTGRNAVCPIMTEGSVCQCTALHRKAQCTGLIAPLLAHFQPQLKPHHTPGGKEKEGLKHLRGLRVWSNDIRHGPIEENLPVTFQVSSPLLVNHRKRSHLWLRFGCKWGTWECSLLGDMIQMFRRQVSYAAQPSRGA